MKIPCLMLIEPDLLIRTPLAQYLRECGFHVVEAFTTSEARSILTDADITIETILMDADGPDESGFVFCAWMRVNHPQVDVVLAGNVERTVSHAGSLCEDGPALVKPYDHKLVLQEIRRRLAARERHGGG